MSVTAESLLAEAATWEGTPFRHQANPGVKGVATDCVGFIRGVAQIVGINDGYEGRNTYSRIATGQLIKILSDLLVHVNELRAGDVILFGLSGPEHHVGIYDGKYVWHAHEELGKVIKTRYVGSMKERTKGIFRFKELCPDG